MLAAVWLPYMVVYCTKCPEAATTLARCSVAVAAKAQAHAHSTIDAHDHHGRLPDANGHSRGERHATGHQHPSEQADNHHHDGAGDCCESVLSRLAKTSPFDFEDLHPAAVLTTRLPLWTALAQLTSSMRAHKFDHRPHSPPLYLVLLTLLN